MATEVAFFYCPLKEETRLLVSKRQMRWESLEKNYLDILRRRLSEKTCVHSQGVGSMAKDLAKGQGLSGEKGYLAGVLHDYAREMADKDLLREARRLNIHVDPVMRVHPILLHGPVGAGLIREELGITDGDILEAVSCHTCGRQKMGLLARIIYAADIIEESRDFPGVQELRRQVRKNFSLGLPQVVESTINYVLRQHYLLHPATVDFWNELILEREK